MAPVSSLIITLIACPSCNVPFVHCEFDPDETFSDDVLENQVITFTCHDCRTAVTELPRQQALRTVVVDVNAQTHSSPHILHI